MNAKALEAWWKRPMQTRVFERCEECNQLKEHVQKRSYYTGWTKHETLCCPDCFVELSNGHGYLLITRKTKCNLQS